MYFRFVNFKNVAYDHWLDVHMTAKTVHVYCVLNYCLCMKPSFKPSLKTTIVQSLSCLQFMLILINVKSISVYICTQQVVSILNNHFSKEVYLETEQSVWENGLKKYTSIIGNLNQKTSDSLFPHTRHYSLPTASESVESVESNVCWLHLSGLLGADGLTVKQTK